MSKTSITHHNLHGEASSGVYTHSFSAERRFLARSLEYLDGRSSAFHVSLSLALVVILGWINYAAVHDVSAGIFYLIPVSLGSWFLSSIARIVVYFFTATVWLGVDVYLGQAGVQSAVSYRNAFVGFVFLILFGLILAGLRKAYNHQKELARTDYLTQLANARSFYEAAELEIGRLRRYEHPFTLAYLDIDDFKAVNDEHGHAEGNRLLKTLGHAATRNLRETDLVARLGGDEFAILMPETEADAARTAIEKLRHFLLDEMRNHGWAVTFSIGVVTCKTAPESVSDVLKLGDRLAYEAKNSGKDAARYDVIGQ